MRIFALFLAITLTLGGLGAGYLHYSERQKQEEKEEEDISNFIDSANEFARGLDVGLLNKADFLLTYGRLDYQWKQIKNSGWFFSSQYAALHEPIAHTFQGWNTIRLVWIFKDQLETDMLSFDEKTYDDLSDALGVALGNDAAKEAMGKIFGKTAAVSALLVKTIRLKTESELQSVTHEFTKLRKISINPFIQGNTALWISGWGVSIVLLVLYLAVSGRADQAKGESFVTDQKESSLPQSTPNPVSVKSRISSLDLLFSKGVINQEAYETKKTEILNELKG